MKKLPKIIILSLAIYSVFGFTHIAHADYWQDISVTCSASRTNIGINESVTYTAYATGGTGDYTYNWSGAYSGNNYIYSTSYNTEGTKTTNVTVRDSNGRSATATCSPVYVGNSYNNYPYNYNNNLDGSCYASPSSVSQNQNINWYATATGGNGNYSYSWTGSDSLTGYGSQISRSYVWTGSKYATVNITSNGQTISRTCYANVTDGYSYNGNNGYYYGNQGNLSVSCSANPSYIGAGQNIQWNAYASGGNGSYTYSWTGTDGLSYGNASAIQKPYTIGGIKTANVTVYDSYGRSATASCSATVTGGQVYVDQYNNPNAPLFDYPGYEYPSTGHQTGVYLSQVPATGISFGLKIALFFFGLIAWSLAIGYVIMYKRKESLRLRTSNVPNSIANKVLAFKEANRVKRNK